MDIRKAWHAAQVALEKAGDPIATAAAWTTARAFLDPARRMRETGPLEHSLQAAAALVTLERAGLQDALIESYLGAVRNCFVVVHEHILAFLDQYDAAQQAESDRAPTVVAELLHQIGLWSRTWQRPVEQFWPTAAPLALYRQCFLTSLYDALPPRFAVAFTAYLRSLLHDPSPGSSPERELAMPTLITLLDRYDPLLFGLIYEEIERKVDRECREHFTEPKLAALLEWLNGGVLAWVSRIYARSVEGGQEEAKKMLKPTFSRFEYHVGKVLCALRTTELWDMIVDYPNSLPALEDLKICLYKTDQRTLLVTRLRASNEKRLLHPGAATRDIITHYIATIKCLRVLDPQGVLLSRVADPIRQYLRAREDTIRCIVTSLIEEGNELVAELSSTDARPLQDARDEAENFNDPKWTPDPVDAPLDFRKSKGSDIIQLLVSIYDTKDVFVKELQVLLAQRLLLIKDYALEREIKNVEILKIRFGEASLQGCEVMIKDLQDSKRIDQHVHTQLPSLPLHLTVVSRLFWPSFQNAALKLPGQLGAAQDSYNKSFAGLKPDKKLRWLPQLGTVNLTLDLTDRSLTIDASPLQASLIELFGQQAAWAEDDLGAELFVTDSATLRNALYFWANAGVLKNVQGEEWVLLEVAESGADAAVSHVLEQVADAVQSVDAQQVEQMRVFSKFIQGILTNLGSKNAMELHSALSQYVADYKGHTVEQLQSLLGLMQAEGSVEKTGADTWKIVK